MPANKSASLKGWSLNNGSWLGGFIAEKLPEGICKQTLAQRAPLCQAAAERTTIGGCAGLTPVLSKPILKNIKQYSALAVIQRVIFSRAHPRL
ncbi:MAG: hypothetical protein ACUVS2_14985 [Candidatus Flexifilum sp.]